MDAMSSHLIRVVPDDGLDVVTPDEDAVHGATARRFSAPLRRAILRTRNWLLERQHADGYWEGELEGDSILQTEYLLLLAFLGREKSAVAARVAERLVETQCATGGWGQYPGAGIDISASVKAYFALKLTGHAPHLDYMQRARAAILRHGGADAVNSFTRYYLALLGQVPYELCPAVPPEAMLLPTWAPVNIYRISAWSRTIFVPLSIVWATRPVRKLDAGQGIRELFLCEPKDWRPLACPGKKSTGKLSWAGFFRGVDRAIKACERVGFTPLRRRSVEAARRWMLDRCEGSDGLGAIFPPIIWVAIALKGLGYADESPEVQYNLDQLDALMLKGETSTRLQPCKSPIWDTAIAMRALSESGVDAASDAIWSATEWLLSKEATIEGDWAKTVRAEPGGWYFEHANAFYPDVDDTAMVLMALNPPPAAEGGDMPDDVLPPGLSVVDAGRTRDLGAARQRAALVDRVAAATERGLAWTLAMQNRDGGWGAFDRDNDMQVLCEVPFADHNAMIDPSSPDLTGRVLEALGRLGKRVGDPAVDRALAYVRRTQEPDGSWYGRWGVNYIYGTWQTLVGLAAVGVPQDDPAMVAGANWLLTCQQPSGGWGESPDSYADRSRRGIGPPTASQTAWAVMGLLAAGLHQHPATARGVRFLLAQQNDDGAWDETEFTGTGFPLVFYLRYHLYPIYFPLQALARWAKAIGADLRQGDDAACAFDEDSASGVATAPQPLTIFADCD
ncbi:MAG: squalene--hopene cyclase [Planctomycetota bacterium]|nr:MAG: squalene--hopene cyclase [Planctomycetota bacterium]